jgi:hypothetical protein
MQLPTRIYLPQDVPGSVTTNERASSKSMHSRHTAVVCLVSPQHYDLVYIVCCLKLPIPGHCYWWHVAVRKSCGVQKASSCMPPGLNINPPLRFNLAFSMPSQHSQFTEWRRLTDCIIFDKPTIRGGHWQEWRQNVSQHLSTCPKRTAFRTNSKQAVWCPSNFLVYKVSISNALTDHK